MLRRRHHGRSRATRSARWATRAAWPIQGLIRHFRPEMERRIRARTEKLAAE